MSGFHDILVPIDYEPAGDAALRVAARLARAGKGRLLVAHMLPLPVYTMAEVPIAPIDGRWIAEEGARLRAHVTRVAEVDGETPPFDVEVCVDTPAVRIIQLAAERRVDLIVMGTHGRRGLKHALLGSVAARVVRLAPCPVLTVHGDREPHLGMLAKDAEMRRSETAVAGPGEVGELMRRSAITIEPGAMLAEAHRLMAEHHIRHLPVVEGGKLVGILALGDLGPHVGQLARTKVNAAMTPNPVTIGPTAEAAAAARLMLANAVRALPVVEGARVVGIIATSDILEEYARIARGKDAA